MRYIALAVCLVMVLFAGPYHGNTTCPSSGNLAVSSLTTKYAQYTIQAKSTNTGIVHVGNYTVTSSTGIELPVNYSYNANPQSNIRPYDLSTVFIACTVNTDGVNWIAQ